MANGVVGLKPTYGRVSRYGVHALSETLDHVGPMARSVADAATVLEAIAGPDTHDPTTLDEQASGILQEIDRGIVGMKIGYDRAFSSDGVDNGLVTAIDSALTVLESLGASIVDVEMPIDPAAISETWFAICSREAFNAHARTFPSRADEYGPYFREFLEFGASITNEQYAAAMEARRAFNTSFTALLDSVDAVICPSGGFTLPASHEALYGGMADLQPLFDGVQMHFTIPANFAGTPTLTVPCGFSENALPYSLQILGPRLSEARLCRIGHAYEQDTEWHRHHPPV
jgi:amidase